MMASFSVACSCSWPKFAHGDFGPGFFSASMRSNVAAVAASSGVTWGMLNACGWKSTVSTMHSALVSVA
eukprot:8374466-Ditylum_brightwellii.AAC.1